MLWCLIVALVRESNQRRTGRGSWGLQPPPSFGQNLKFGHKNDIFRHPVRFSLERRCTFWAKSGLAPPPSIFRCRSPMKEIPFNGIAIKTVLPILGSISVFLHVSADRCHTRQMAYCRQYLLFGILYGKWIRKIGNEKKLRPSFLKTTGHVRPSKQIWNF